MNKAIIGLVLLIIGALGVQLYLIGFNNHELFVSASTFQWIILGIAVMACIAGICLLFGKPRKANSSKGLKMIIIIMSND